jgi:uncharacterized protein
LSKGFPFLPAREERDGLRQAQPERRWLVALFAILALLCAVPAAAQTFPQLTGRVVDQANIIPDDREAAMVQQLEQLQRATSRQLVVATVSSLEGHDIQDYAYRLGRHWQIGQAGADNGVVLLVAPNERRVWITVGYGLEGILTDAFTGQVVREQILPRFRENDYPGGIEAGVARLVSQLAAPPEQAEQQAIEAERARERERSGGGGGAGIVVIAILIIFGIPFLLAVIGSAGSRRRSRVSPWGRDYDRNDGADVGWVVAGAVLDAFLSGRGGGSSGGSWGGGGGSSWGGGGGGFSGGGGSFGGGGAGGSW